MNDAKVSPLSAALGAEVSGVDLSKVSGDDITLINELIFKHKVLFFPKQSLSQAEHVSLGRKFGPLAGHPNLSNADGFPEIFELKASEGGVANEWHTDLTFQQNPAKLSILYMRICPVLGGDTMWTNLELAYDALSEPMKVLCESLTALHDADPHGPDGHKQMAIHPVVRVHPESGRKALYVSEHFTRRIVEMRYEESEVFLNFLCRWVQRPQFTVRYRWSENVIAFWDNTTTSHYVLNDFSQDRMIQRVTIQGDVPMPAAQKLPIYSPVIYQKLDNAGKNNWKPNFAANGRHDRQLMNYLSANGAYRIPKL
mmetsp:Transcript_4003/g.4626  ORF Transcript_4003/g.4626 Transcript_4003/m.4626 type:complete len:312 (-) Transcript_4003:186-1121(-)|eukprot:CAMPEP_0184016612 /NCGR_PEP_ID=MMETSP0954-20121128/7029_1 /TAXON_ID=627963 /ORGANISM="Aplanochytrium sp, Strain PBS07" /LENGTH=311 /DNA_ID=CAMNT_0026297659 /DNA_START=189 /DNA_END=1124 /DNA_ORIENTATION=-